jgi:hypothetical protein
MMRMCVRMRMACVALLTVGASVSCSVDQTREAAAPDVDVDVDPGRWPQYDVNWADVEVGTSQRTVQVPVVRVDREPREITVPYIDIDVPGAGEAEDRTVTVAADVPHGGYALEIQEVRAAGDDLWVVARLMEQGGGSATQAMTRVSDRVVVSAPDDLDVRTVIVGERPGTGDNQQHRFVSSMDDVNRMIPDQARVLYQRGAGA